MCKDCIQGRIGRRRGSPLKKKKKKKAFSYVEHSVVWTDLYPKPGFGLTKMVLSEDLQ